MNFIKKLFERNSESSKAIKTVILGKQEWMVKNMAVTVDRDGDELVLGKDYWYPNGDESQVEQYGLLYSWEAAMRIAPKGWHLPADAEWAQLEEYVGSQPQYRCGDSERNIAKALASTLGWGWTYGSAPETVGYNPSENNATGFSAVPAGCYNSGLCKYGRFGINAYFWSAKGDAAGQALSWNLHFEYPDLSSLYFGKDYGFSVRCLRD